MQLYQIESVEFRPNTHAEDGAGYKEKKTRAYFSLEGESMLDNLSNRFDRPREMYRLLLPELFKLAKKTEMFTSAQLEGMQKNVKWSQYAGCSCPCSPGFIFPHFRGYEIFVSILVRPEIAEAIEFGRQLGLQQAHDALNEMVNGEGFADEIEELMADSKIG